MSFWEKMLQGLKENLLPKKIDDDVLLREMYSALQEAESLRQQNQNNFIDPCQLEAYLSRWQDAYVAASKKTSSLGFRLGLTGKGLRQLGPQFVDCYEAVPSYIQHHNTALAAAKAQEAAKLILPVEGRQLDEQQLQCIVQEVKSHLVLAGAGTGKTTTIIGYVKYLLATKACGPQDILVLSFTNASAAEMSQRLQQEIGRPIEATTFHKLGLNIITAVHKQRPKIFSSDVRAFVRRQLDFLILEERYLEQLNKYLSFYCTEQKTLHDFETQEEYEAQLKYNPPTTMRGEKVKSYGEMDIANFLLQHGVRYEYEAAYPIDTRTEQFSQYHPDFYLPDYNIYIEYFAINRQGEVPKYFKGRQDKSATELYNEGIMWKRQLHRTYGSTLIEVYAYEKLEETLLEALEDQLAAAGVVFKPVDAQKIWSHLEGSHKQKLDRLAELFATVINLVKSNDCTLEDIAQRNQGFKRLRGVTIALELLRPIYNAYQSLLQEQEYVDFNDMINLAAHYVAAGRYQHRYKYVLVDEYQDISQARYKLLAAMRASRDYRLFCVGDDWQSIYRFSGSDIGFILNFAKYWGPCATSMIETTYRFPKSIIEISGKFIMANPEQKRKQLKSLIDSGEFSLQLLEGYKEEYLHRLIGQSLDQLPPSSSVLFLGRYRFDIKLVEASPLFSYYYDAKSGKTMVQYKRRSDLHIEFLSVHSSKGLQADYVYILNNKERGMGFPSQISNAPILQLLLDNSDHYPFAEERRLYYVALTRAKKQVFLVTLKGNQSVFVQELLEAYGKRIVAPKAEKAGSSTPAKAGGNIGTQVCPRCGGRLILRKGSYGSFYGCENFAKTGCRYTQKV